MTLLLAALLLATGAGRADVPTPAEECRLRNAAICGFPSGVESHVDGPCPAGARTLRPPGRADCAEVQPSAPTPREDPAEIGGVERWLVPTLLAVGGAIGLGVLAFVTWRLLRSPGARGAGLGALPIVVGVGVAGVGGGWVAWRAAGAAFRYVFDGFDNHDSAAPLLVATPVAAAVFLVAWPAVSGGIALVLGAVWGAGDRRGRG